MSQRSTSAPPAAADEWGWANESAAPHGAQAAEGGLSLQELLGTLWGGKWIILAVLLLVVGAAFAYVSTTPPEYDASTLLLVEDAQSDVASELQFGFQSGRSLENEMFVLQQSQDIAEQVAARLLEARDVPGTGEPLTLIYNEEGEVLPLEVVAARARARMYARKASGQGVNAFRIHGVSTVPGEAAFLADLYAQAYVQWVQETSRGRLVASRDFLEDQGDRLRSTLDDMEAQIANFMQEQGATALDQESSRLVEQLSTLETQMEELTLEEEMLQQSLQRKRARLNELEPRLTAQIASDTQQRLEAVQNELADVELQLEVIYQENPDLRNVEAREAPPAVARLLRREATLQQRVEELADQYAEEAVTEAGNLLGEGAAALAPVAALRTSIAEDEVALTSIRARRDVLTERLREQEERLRNIPAQSIQLAQMQRARTSTSRLYTFITERLQEVRIAEESEIGYAEVLRSAGRPSNPVRPNKERSLMLATLLGLALGGGLVLLRSQLDTRIHHPGDLRQHGFSVLGVIPDMERLIEQDFGGKEYVEVDGRTMASRLIMLLSPMSASAEAYRRLRANIQFSRPDTVVQTLLFTSAEMAEGKTTTALNAAVAMAQASRRTVVIDADLRRPRTHKLLGMAREPGLTELLFDQISLEPGRFATHIENLDLIPAGGSVPNPAELMGSRKMRDLIAQLREHYDVIVFDTPPMLAFSDAMLLATQCDGTVFVSRAEQTDERALDHATEMLDGVGAVVLGAVLNRFDARRSKGGGYGYGYGYRYGYGYYYDYSSYYNREDGEGAPKKRLQG